MKKEDILFFESMLTPKIITLVYWLLLLGAAITGLTIMFGGFGGFTFGKFLTGIVVAVGGAIGARIWCELLIVLFKMNEALQEMRPAGYSAVEDETTPGGDDS